MPASLEGEAGSLYKENHALDAWFCIAYGDEQKEN